MEAVPAASFPGNTATNQRPSSAFESHQLAIERERKKFPGKACAIVSVYWCSLSVVKVVMKIVIFYFYS